MIYTSNFTAGRDFQRAICPRQRREEISSEHSVPASGGKRSPASNQSQPAAGRNFPQAISPRQRREDISSEQSAHAHDNKYFFNLFSNKYCIFAEKLNKY
jgi:hypothetical protein